MTSVRAGLRPDAPAPLTRRAASPAEALIEGSWAALSVGLGMLLLRSTLEVRSIPERTMEWLLLFVPTSVFEDLLLRFGLEAKRYALDAAIVLMLAALAALGYVVLRAGWRVAAIAMLGVAFWLFVMQVVMPLTSAGVFAMDLEDGKRATIGGYLAVGLSYAAVLAAIHTWIAVRARVGVSVALWGGCARVDRLHSRWSESIDRRLAIGLIGTAGVAYVAAYAVALLLPKREVAPAF